jgi:hypothetical protein
MRGAEPYLAMLAEHDGVHMERVRKTNSHSQLMPKTFLSAARPIRFDTWAPARQAPINHEGG